ncbi:MAG: hypothetical protein ONB16_11430, partial [candidate division KSB1 bacterium]|nr:hypothetical protein [candidate division KSB1 bacterium]
TERKNAMAKIIKVRCNGKNHHVNEVDIDEITKPTLVVRGEPLRQLRERYVVPCKYCSDGQVVITKKMIDEL